jgi:hypothetical protein
MGRYVDWPDVKPLVQEFEAQPQQSQMREAIGWAEDYFDGRLRERYAVPFTSASHPNAYALAQRIVKRWAAADYLVNRRQAEGDEERATWYANRLTRTADSLFEQFEEGAPPDDAEEAEDAFSEAPADGYDSLTTTEQTAADPIFKRSRIVPGGSNRW